MKGKKAILTLLALILLGTNSLVYANVTSPPAIQCEMSQEDFAELYNKAGLDRPEIIINTLAALGISKEELQGYMGQGKKICDVLEEKEIAPIEFRDALAKEYRCAIKRARKSKVITRKESKVLNRLLEQKMANWDV